MKKKPSSLFLLPLVALMIMGLFTRLIASVYPLIIWLEDAHWLVHLILPLILLGAAIVLHWTAKGRAAVYLLSYLLNAIASGCTVGAIFGIRGYIPSPGLLAALIPAACICLLSIPLPKLSKELWQEIATVVLIVLGIGLTVAGVFIWPLRSMPIGCSLLFAGLFILPLPYAVYAAGEEPQDRFRYLSFSGFGACILIITVAAFILSDGDILDGLDIGGIGGSQKKKGK